MKYTWEILANGNAVNNVQGMSYSFGRRLKTDTFQPTTISLEGIKPNLLPSISVGTNFAIAAYNGATPVFTWYGVVNDFRINYGIVASMDTFVIDLEDSLAQAGRTVWSGTTTNNKQTALAAAEIGNFANVYVETVAGANNPGNGSQYCSAIVGSNDNMLDSFNQIAATEQGIINGTGGAIIFSPRSPAGASPVIELTDTTPQNAAIATTYQTLQIGGIADITASQVVVEPEGLASQSAGSPPRSFTVRTFDVSTAQAASTASYIYSLLDFTVSKPISVSYFMESQTNDAGMNPYPYAVNINFRGTKYTCEVLGGTMYATPDSTRWTLNLNKLPYDKFNFTLDSTYYGVLNQDKLG